MQYKKVNKKNSVYRDFMKMHVNPTQPAQACQDQKNKVKCNCGEELPLANVEEITTKKRSNIWHSIKT